jgi:hypothetical protein
MLRGRALTALVLALVLGCAPAWAQVDGEQHTPGSACTFGATAGHGNAPDWDTIFECNGSTQWQRGPYFFGSTSDTCDSNHAGMVQWTGSVFEGCNGTSWGTLDASVALSALTASMTAHTFDNAAYAQTWTWNSLTTGTALSLTSSTMTTGTLLNLANSNTASSTGVVLNVSNSEAGASYAIEGSSASTGAGVGVYGTITGASNTGYAVYGLDNSASGYGVYGSSSSGYGVYSNGAAAVAGNLTVTSGNINIATSTKALQLGGATVLTYPDGGADTTSWADGPGALASQTTISLNNTAVGDQAMNQNTIGLENTALGYFAGYHITGADNTAVGGEAMRYDVGGAGNVAIGTATLDGLGTSAAIVNVAAGYYAMDANTGGAYNVGVGGYALGTNTTGNLNTALGYKTGWTITTGSNNVVIGPSVASVTLATGSNNILIGTSANTDTPSSSTSNYLNIGNLIEGDLGIQHVVLNGTAPAIGSGSSDCGTSPAIAGNDNVGLITVGSSTNGGLCTVTFHTAWTTAPVCFCQDRTTGNILKPPSTTTTLKCTGTLTAADQISYLCIGYQL